MKRVLHFLLILAAGGVLSVFRVAAESQPPAVGGVLPDFVLAVPDDPEQQQYLGITGKDAFRITDIKAQVVILEIFNMYWPYCQKEAPSVNEVYRTVETDENLKGKVKLIGIGAGNSPFEVGYFKEYYHIPFPLFADSDFSIHEKLGGVRTPYFIAIRIMGDGTHTVYYTQLGGAGDAAQLMQKLLEGSGLN